MSATKPPVLGTRRLQVVEDRARVRYVTVTIGLPRPARGGDWECSIQITGAGLRVTDRPMGADAQQAAQIAFETVRQALERSGLRLTWLQGEAQEKLGDWTGFDDSLIPRLVGPDAGAGRKQSSR